MKKMFFALAFVAMFGLFLTGCENETNNDTKGSNDIVETIENNNLEENYEESSYDYSEETPADYDEETYEEDYEYGE